MSEDQARKKPAYSGPKSLQDQINELKLQVGKQRKVLAETAQQLLGLQLKQSREQLAAIPNPDPASVLASEGSRGSTTSLDNTDFATNEDLVQLVSELQGQLTILDQRSYNRVSNSLLTEDDEEILPLPDVDGNFAPKDIYPGTVREFKDLSAEKLIKLSSFYELLPETAEEEARMKAFIAGKITSPNVPPEEFQPKADDYSSETLDKLYEDFRKFIGVRFKRHSK
ncbi:DEKNAAC100233 [Brettanomyces naardenensis]|uniref:DEKNAAC100233 n=1 Tax=Brettanomyces naardenensis TaxID=13370 RepID=A0A448YFM0_BRENA|nr:DEKNAAC100233 [Brettanomyces naardenensis]